jgi:hypothetical protein
MAIDQIRTDEELTALDRSGYHLDDIRRPGAVAEPGLGRGIAKVEVHPDEIRVAHRETSLGKIA